MENNESATVSFTYELMSDKGQVIETSKNNPISISRGSHKNFAPIEDLLFSLKPGVEEKVFLKSAEAYGSYNEKLVYEVPKSKFGVEPKIGSVFKVRTGQGLFKEMKVVDFKDDFCILDGNHPLAGMDVCFNIKIVEV